ncbi:MAG: hypothetical protein JJV88_00220 [Sulfurovum sp.]|nr:hypothetical protein [Sulfurovaceae bacterium]
MNVKNIFAVRIAQDREYQINGTGEVGKMLKGVTVVGEAVESFDFVDVGFNIEVMDKPMSEDSNHIPIQGFTPNRIEAV